MYVNFLVKQCHEVSYRPVELPATVSVLQHGPQEREVSQNDTLVGVAGDLDVLHLLIYRFGLVVESTFEDEAVDDIERTDSESPHGVNRALWHFLVR